MILENYTNLWRIFVFEETNSIAFIFPRNFRGIISLIRIKTVNIGWNLFCLFVYYHETSGRIKS